MLTSQRRYGGLRLPLGTMRRRPTSPLTMYMTYVLHTTHSISTSVLQPVMLGSTRLSTLILKAQILRNSTSEPSSTTGMLTSSVQPKVLLRSTQLRLLTTTNLFLRRILVRRMVLPSILTQTSGRSMRTVLTTSHLSTTGQESTSSQFVVNSTSSLTALSSRCLPHSSLTKKSPLTTQHTALLARASLVTRILTTTSAL